MFQTRLWLTVSEPQRVQGGVTTERLSAFSDGVFAIAITLLVLDLHVPAVSHGQSLLDEVLKEWPAYLSYVLTFSIIGIIWAQHHYIFRFIERSDHVFVLINILFLMWIVFLPYPTHILGAYLDNPSQRQTAMEIYAATWVVGTIPFNLLWNYAAYRGRLLDKNADPVAVRRTTQSYYIGPVLYLAVFLVAFVNPIASLVLTIALAVFYAVSPIVAGSYIRTKPPGKTEPRESPEKVKPE